jgi:hypothetical protein
MTTTTPTPQLRPHIPTCLTSRTPKNGKQQALILCCGVEQRAGAARAQPQAGGLDGDSWWSFPGRRVALSRMSMSRCSPGSKRSDYADLSVTKPLPRNGSTTHIGIMQRASWDEGFGAEHLVHGGQGPGAMTTSSPSSNVKPRSTRSASRARTTVLFLRRAGPTARPAFWCRRR